MELEDYKKLLAIEEVNTFFTKIYSCWEELESNNESNKQLAMKDIKDKFDSLREELTEKNKIINELKIFDREVYFDSFIGNDFFGCVCDKNGYQIELWEEDIEFIRTYVSKNKNSNVLVELKSPAETRYIEAVKEIKKLKRKTKIYKMKRNFYDKMDDFSSGFYYMDKWNEASNNEIKFSNKCERILSDQRKMEFFKGLTFEQYKAFLDCYDSFCNCSTSYQEYKNTEKTLNKTMYISENEMYEKVLSNLLQKELITQQELMNVKFHIFNFMLFKDETLTFPNQLVTNVPLRYRSIINLFITSQGIDSYSSIFAKEVYNVSVENKEKILSKIMF